MSRRRRDGHEISPGLYGWLESPRPQDGVLDCLVVSGWTFSRASPVIEISVQISGHRESVQINARATPILAQEVIAAQSAQIDTVSGATYTSEAYAQSVQAAIDQAG